MTIYLLEGENPENWPFKSRVLVRALKIITPDMGVGFIVKEGSDNKRIIKSRK